MLSDKRILEEMQKGNIVIEPFNLDFIGPNSYDCTLGPWFYQSNPLMEEVFVDNPDDIKRYWIGPLQAPLFKEQEQAYIPVNPGQTILAHTQERVGARNGFVAKMYSKSSTARYALSVCKCAGLGDVGYDAVWTLEISNHGTSKVWLPVGMKICQFVFFEVGETLKEYEGNYGQNADFKPEHMLPKAAKVAR